MQPGPDQRADTRDVMGARQSAECSSFRTGVVALDAAGSVIKSLRLGKDPMTLCCVEVVCFVGNTLLHLALRVRKIVCASAFYGKKIFVRPEIQPSRLGWERDAEIKFIIIVDSLPDVFGSTRKRDEPLVQ